MALIEYEINSVVKSFNFDLPEILHLKLDPLNHSIQWVTEFKEDYNKDPEGAYLYTTFYTNKNFFASFYIYMIYKYKKNEQISDELAKIFEEIIPEYRVAEKFTYERGIELEIEKVIHPPIPTAPAIETS